MLGNRDLRLQLVHELRRLGRRHCVGPAHRHERDVAGDRAVLEDVIGVAGHVDDHAVMRRDDVAHPAVLARMERLELVVRRHRLDREARQRADRLARRDEQGIRQLALHAARRDEAGPLAGDPRDVLGRVVVVVRVRDEDQVRVVRRVLEQVRIDVAHGTRAGIDADRRMRVDGDEVGMHGCSSHRALASSIPNHSRSVPLASGQRIAYRPRWVSSSQWTRARGAGRWRSSSRAGAATRRSREGARAARRRRARGRGWPRRNRRCPRAAGCPSPCRAA